jgi:SepF-like predicted cell division protein (DUF552 family)
MHFELSGLDSVRKRLQTVRDGVAAVCADLPPLTFDPHDDAAVAEAVRQAEAIIDERSEPYRDDEVVMAKATDMKRIAVDHIQRVVAEARNQQK